MEKEIHLSVVIPAHNEEKRIGQTLDSIAGYLNKQSYEYEVIVADDGSTDKTDEVCYSRKKIINHLTVSSKKKDSVSMGKGDAVSRGMLLSSGRYCIFIDADDATPFWQVEKLLKSIEKEDYDIAIGSRYIAGAKLVPPRGAFRTFVSRGGNIIINTFLKLPYKDTRCGFKLFTKKSADQIFSKILLPGFSFDDEVLVLAKKFNLKVKEVPVEWHEKGESKVSVKDVFKSFAEMWQIRKNLKHRKYDN